MNMQNLLDQFMGLGSGGSTPIPRVTVLAFNILGKLRIGLEVGESAKLGFTPPALPERIWGSNAAIWQVLTGPSEVVTLASQRIGRRKLLPAF
jgi:hypothetical protein